MSSSPRIRTPERREALLRLRSMLPLRNSLQWSCSLVLGLAVSIGINTCSDHNAHAKIYTYERDGVVVISSEPPPKFHRPRRAHRNIQRRREAQSRSSRSTSSKPVEVSAPVQKKRKRSSRRPSIKRNRRTSWRPHLSIGRYREQLKRAALHYQLPPRILWSVLSACPCLRVA